MEVVAAYFFGAVSDSKVLFYLGKRRKVERESSPFATWLSDNEPVLLWGEPGCWESVIKRNGRTRSPTVSLRSVSCVYFKLFGFQ